eukprot:5111917-Pleurochrysis_carterae.AAC.2
MAGSCGLYAYACRRVRSRFNGLRASIGRQHFTRDCWARLVLSTRHLEYTKAHASTVSWTAACLLKFIDAGPLQESKGLIRQPRSTPHGGLGPTR